MKLLGSVLIALFVVMMPQAVISKVRVVDTSTARPMDIVWTSKNKHGQVVVHLYMYWGLQCPHCHKAMPFIKKMARDYPWIKVHLREISENRRNQVAMYNMAEAIGESNVAIPAFFYCGYLYTGWGDAETTGAWLVDELKQCRGNPV